MKSQRAPLGRTARPLAKRGAVALGALCLALGVAACGTTGSSSGNYKGVKGEVAKAISSFESNATANNPKNVCKENIAASVAKRLEGSGSTCLKAMTSQLRQIDTFTMTVESISVKGNTASAQVKSTWYGKQRLNTLSFVKEEGSWKLASLS